MAHSKFYFTGTLTTVSNSNPTSCIQTWKNNAEKKKGSVKWNFINASSVMTTVQ